ncbi:MAG TPA: 30S ribosomal protein S4e [Candidatus Poseidoniales archaeon]|nr:30S ribosomal protein S4e [Euryarchaeota archaeon]DAC06841.1 MAG TPA: 30S ribosomal protein S4e [Candidatus Poseidoniales archaeon]DAC41069.1 MAG TPA: 30S ribosomal protein S4e [Candidatus Poseidoniales archaeon]HII26753.1 30S ribosomal protein S4e [Candidatus Thalassarchaeaceae archaeon]HII28819.1 30S ribosomal protein S4e [Candidatus Thalassarchaeaceae archaeon]|tara:strand:- start:499 stop:1197 length:699 start_codon:yes stop_codon:yes gene_type:complete
MSSSHMKRLTMPRSWPLPRKSSVWIQKPNPCGHPLDLCMPMGVILRDVLGVAQNRREAKKILHSKLVKVDGAIETDIGRGVGLMDVLTVGDVSYKCVLDTNGKLRYRTIPAKEASTKICRVMGKTTIKGAKTQVHLHDGRNLLFNENPEYKTGDSLVISLPDQEVKSYHKFEEGSIAYLTGGNHIGELATVRGQDIKRSSKANEVQFDDFGTISDYVFIISSESDIPMGDNS